MKILSGICQSFVAHRNSCRFASLKISRYKHETTREIKYENLSTIESAPARGRTEHVILNFFNNCDSVTLRRLINFKPTHFRGVDQNRVLERFSNFSELLNDTKLKVHQLENIAKVIYKFSEDEKSNYGIRNLQPKFTRTDVENIDKVVCLDVYQNTIAWSVQMKETKDICDVGFEILPEDKFKFKYDHVLYHQALLKVLERIPDSEVYLVQSRLHLHGRKSKQNLKFIVNQAVMEALIITLINTRNVTHSSEIVHGLQIPHQQDEYQDNDIMRNSVYVYDMTSFSDFYDIVFGGELMSCNHYLMENLNKSYKGSVPGLFLDARTLKLLQTDVGEYLARCILMSHAFCRCLTKKVEDFPQAYQGKISLKSIY